MMKQSSGMDIFATMEQEMKQIMELFSKERKARKKEMAKLLASKGGLNGAPKALK